MRDRVSRLQSSLPPEADPPQISKVDSGQDSVVQYSMTSGQRSLAQLPKTRRPRRMLSMRISAEALADQLDRPPGRGRGHKGLAEQKIERSTSDYVLEADPARPVVGRLIARGLDDELRGTAYAVIDGTDGRTHHVRLPDLDATSDAAPGGIV